MTFNLRLPSNFLATSLAMLAVAALPRPSSAQDASPVPLTRDDARAIVDDARRIVTPHGIDERKEVKIGGIKQWISVRGHDRRNPILLFIHGGPGYPEMPSSWLYQTPWEEYFTVVQWDQRGTGKTYLANDPASTAATINVQRMVADGEEVTAWLRKTYGKQKIFVMGHSWGTVIGLELAMRHPDWLHAYVGMGQLIASQQNESLSYTFALGQARLRNNAQALKELKSIAPYPAADGSLTVDKVETERKWVVFFGGLSWHRNNNDGVDNAQVLSPDYSDADMNWGAGALSTIVNLLPSLSRIDFDGVNQVGCPLFLFAGRHDYETPSAISTAWFARLWAPQKRLVWFENSAHEIQYQEPGKVFMHLVKDVRPIAERAGDVPPTDGFDRE